MLDTIQKTLDMALEDDPVSAGTRRARYLHRSGDLRTGDEAYLSRATGSISPTRARSRTTTTTSPRQPIFIARSRTGELNALHQRVQPPWCNALPPFPFARARSGGYSLPQPARFFHHDNAKEFVIAVIMQA